MDKQPSENPRAINVASFATARAHEINTMMTAITDIGGTRLAFQRLPRHMQRRAMSHNSKRMPKRLRDVARRQRNRQGVKKKKSDEDGTQQPQKKSRFHRRRPGNLREEYAKRQKRTRWLETHIWHAKRFKMVEQWGWRIPLHPSDKSARAAYRATARHCVLSDISHLQVIEIQGQEANILQAMKHFTTPEVGLTMAAKAYLSGTRHGRVILYCKDSYPKDVMGPVDYLWQVETKNEEEEEEEKEDTRDGDEMEVEGDSKMKERQLWMWIHPSCWSEVLNELEAVLPQYQVTVASLEDELLRFRLQGPLAHPILLDALHVATVTTNNKDREEQQRTYWWENYYEDVQQYETLEMQEASWDDLREIQSTAELPSNAVVSLTVRDPRVVLPKKRTKIMADPNNLPDFPRHQSAQKRPEEVSVSPLWSPDVRRAVADEQKPHYVLNNLRSKLLVPGTDLDLGRDESRVPVLLLQQPGSRSLIGTGSGPDREGSCMLGYGGGWDLVVPRKWGMAFWIGLVFRGARAVGLREAGKVALHRSLPRYPDDFPDAESGRNQAEAVADDREQTFSRKPPAKRPNYPKLGIPAPFLPAWPKLIGEWASRTTCEHVKPDDSENCQEWHVLRSRLKLQAIQKELLCLGQKKAPSKTHGLSRARQFAKGKADTQNGGQTKLPAGAKGLEKDDRGSTPCLDPLINVLLPSECRTLVWVGLRMIGRGFPSEFAVICLPDATDLTALARDATFSGPMEPLHKEFSRRRMRKLENPGKVAKRKKVKVVKKSDPEPPSTPADFGYTSGKEMDCSDSGPMGALKESEPLQDIAKDTKSLIGNPNEGNGMESPRAPVTQAVSKSSGAGDKVVVKSGEECKDIKRKGSNIKSNITAGQTVQGAANTKQDSGQGLEKGQQVFGRKSIAALFPDLVGSCSRELIGFVTNGAQAFSIGVGMGTGFVATLGLLQLLRISPQGRKPVVLVRDTQSLQYRFAYIYIPQ